MAEQKKPVVVLDFDAVERVERVARYKGVEYPILSEEDFGPEINAQNRKLLRLNQQLYETPTPENVEAAGKIRDELIAKIAPEFAARPDFADIKPQIKESIIEIFFEAVANLDYRPKPPQDK